MKTILALSDIHANFPALQAIQNHVRKHRFDWIVNTGDFTVYGTFPNETIKWFRERKNVVGVLGNADKRVLRIIRGKKLKKPKKEEKRVMYFWTCDNLLSENIQYLKSLPRQTEIIVAKTRIGIFHGTCVNENEALLPATTNRLRELAQDSRFRIHLMGHSHTPYYRVVDGVHFINPGSVGRMFDGDPRAAFAILKLSAGNIAVEHVRIPYPVEDVVKGLKQNRLPDIYAKMYRMGRKLN